MSPVDYPARPAREGRGGGKRLVPPRRDDVARCFVAVFPPAPVLDTLGDLRQRLEPLLPGLRWTTPANLHFTLRFFGDLVPDDREAAAECLDRVVPSRPVFPVELSGIGVFPHGRRPRVLWVGVGAGSETLVSLARALEHEFREARLGRADKTFVPHLTLGRWREGAPLPPPDAAAKAGIGTLGSFPVVEVGLIQSVLGPGGPKYTPIHTAVLGSSGSA